MTQLLVAPCTMLRVRRHKTVFSVLTDTATFFVPGQGAGADGVDTTQPTQSQPRCGLRSKESSACIVMPQPWCIPHSPLTCCRATSFVISRSSLSRRSINCRLTPRCPCTVLHPPAASLQLQGNRPEGFNRQCHRAMLMSKVDQYRRGWMVCMHAKGVSAVARNHQLRSVTFCRGCFVSHFASTWVALAATTTSSKAAAVITRG